MWSLLSPPIGQLILAPDWSSQGDSWLVKILNQISQPTDLQIKIWHVITGDRRKSPIPHSSLKRNLNNWFKSFSDLKVLRYFCTELYLFIFNVWTDARVCYNNLWGYCCTILFCTMSDVRKLKVKFSCFAWIAAVSRQPKVISPQMRSHLKCDGQLRWILGVMRCDGVTRMRPDPAAPPHMKNWKWKLRLSKARAGLCLPWPCQGWSLGAWGTL